MQVGYLSNEGHITADNAYGFDSGFDQTVQDVAASTQAASAVRFHEPAWLYHAGLKVWKPQLLQQEHPQLASPCQTLEQPLACQLPAQSVNQQPPQKQGPPLPIILPHQPQLSARQPVARRRYNSMKVKVIGGLQDESKRAAAAKRAAELRDDRAAKHARRAPQPAGAHATDRPPLENGRAESVQQSSLYQQQSLKPAIKMTTGRAPPRAQRPAHKDPDSFAEKSAQTHNPASHHTLCVIRPKKVLSCWRKRKESQNPGSVVKPGQQSSQSNHAGSAECLKRPRIAPDDCANTPEPPCKKQAAPSDEAGHTVP